MKEPEIRLCYHGSSVQPCSGDLQRRPDGIAGEQLVVARNPGKFHDAELQRNLVYQLLCFFLGNFTFLQVSVQINIQEGGNSSDRHGRAVLRLDRCQIAEVEPLDSLSCIPRRSRDVIPVGFRHLLHSLKCPDLLGNFLSLTDHIIGHGSVSAVVEILPFLFYQEINSV